MGDVNIVKTSEGGYDVTLNGKTVSLPPGSGLRTVRNGHTGYGTETTYIEVVPGGDVNFVDGPTEERLADGEEGLDLAEQLSIAWSDTGGRRRSRLNRKARRTKRNRRNTKRSKLRKLSTRRR